MANYKQRGEECRRLAKLSPKPEDWEHFLEMAQTWEKLADLHELSERLRSSGALLTKPAISAEGFTLAQEAEGAGGRLIEGLGQTRAV